MITAIKIVNVPIIPKYILMKESESVGHSVVSDSL